MNAIYTILIVDDEEHITAILRRILQPHGYKVITTQNPWEVLSLIEKHSVDILISDVDMPRINGLDLVATVRQEFPAVLRILLTGRTTTEGLLRAINESHVYRYLEKPIESATLIATLAQATEHLRKAQQAERLLQNAQRRENLKRDIEGEHPEILQVQLQGSAYVLEVERLLSLAGELEHPLREMVLSAEKAR